MPMSGSGSGPPGPPDIRGVLDAVALVAGVVTLRIPRYDGDKPMYIAVPPVAPVRRRGGGPAVLRPGQAVAVWRGPDPPPTAPPPGGWAFHEALARFIVIESGPT
jgi:hypothetical protein